MLDSLLCENKEYPLAFSIDDCFTILTGKILCPDVFDQSIFSIRVAELNSLIFSSDELFVSHHIRKIGIDISSSKRTAFFII